ncbi:MAG: hypothetical protein LBI15_07035 [Dysgonamonadaceae bacterium]|jgi:hypothetical protein|nr:hypothetical protein [Dysgonamonadaceae bacterium]
MTTIIVDNNNSQAQALLNYISTLPFVKVIKDDLYPDTLQKGYTIEEIREMGYDKLSAHYGVDIRKL